MVPKVSSTKSKVEIFCPILIQKSCCVSNFLPHPHTVEWTILDILHNTIYTHHPPRVSVRDTNSTPTSSFPGNYWIPINGHLKNIKDEDWLHSNSVLTLLPITPECNLDKILLLLPTLVYLCANLVPVLQIDTICKVDVIPLFMQVYRKEQLTEKFHGIN